MFSTKFRIAWTRELRKKIGKLQHEVKDLEVLRMGLRKQSN